MLDAGAPGICHEPTSCFLIAGSSARTDAGIIYTPGGPVAVCVLTADNKDHRWEPDNSGNVFCARVAKEVYEYFAPKK